MLLGFLKYFWRDAIQRISPEGKELLTTRIVSFDISGLNLSPLAGKTFVQYSGSLAGRDFRAISQVAPFVLYDLLPQPCYDAWIALCKLVPLIWQPVIINADKHIVRYLKLCYLCASEMTLHRKKFGSISTTC